METESNPPQTRDQQAKDDRNRRKHKSHAIPATLRPDRRGGGMGNRAKVLHQGRRHAQTATDIRFCDQTIQRADWIDQER